MPNINVSVDDETYDEIRKSDNRSQAIREAFAELRERRKHKCPESKEEYFTRCGKKYGKTGWVEQTEAGPKWRVSPEK